MRNIGIACKKTFLFEFSMLRSFMNKALKTIKSAYGINDTKELYLVSQFDKFDPEECFNYKKV